MPPLLLLERPPKPGGEQEDEGGNDQGHALGATLVTQQYRHRPGEWQQYQRVEYPLPIMDRRRERRSSGDHLTMA